ncbi:MAG: hypothetical protein JNJ61_28220, partial [Anaerolineae bacterium]|nr:hypothetical protein [Anaerolineae bacterium]
MIARKFRLRILITFMVIAAFGIGKALPVYGQTNAADLISKAQTDGSVRVVVRLNVAAQPVPMLTAAAAQAQEQSIRQAQTALLGTLSGYDVNSVTTFQLFPYMTLTVDPAGLQALLSSPQVSAVSEEKQLTLFMENSIALTGANEAWKLGYDGTGQAVAIIDSGVDRNHWFLAGRV